MLGVIRDRPIFCLRIVFVRSYVLAAKAFQRPFAVLEAIEESFLA